MAEKNELPLAQRSWADLPGHWLLARLGKRVLRPGGLEMTERLLAGAGIPGSDVVELGPGLGRTAKDIGALKPSSYVGVDDTAAASVLVQEVVDVTGGRAVNADASETGLPDASADVVIGEAMLTMQGEKAKKAIVDEAFRVLRPGGRYAIHEMALTPDTLPVEAKENVRKDLARAIKVNARPLTVSEWSELLSESGFTVQSVEQLPMALLEPRRVIADEGLFGALRIVGNVLLHPGARKRVLGMRKTFTENRDKMSAVAIVASKNGS